MLKVVLASAVADTPKKGTKIPPVTIARAKNNLFSLFSIGFNIRFDESNIFKR